MNNFKLVQYILILFMCFALTLTSAPESYARELEIGIFQPGAAYDTHELSPLSHDLGITFGSIKWYMDWSESLDPEPAHAVHKYGAIPEVVWQPQINGQTVRFSDVIEGKYQSYLELFGNTIRDLHFPIRIILAPEMNVHWTPWYVSREGQPAELFRLFWQSTVRTVRDAGANNIEWIWAPNIHHSSEQYSYLDLYPGNQYVDYLGLDGYNWGTSREGTEWLTFDEVFKSSYQDITSVSAHPLFITETASTELGGDKSQWIIDAFHQIQTSYPRIQAITWFNMNKETDWRIDSSLQAKTAFQRAMHGDFEHPVRPDTEADVNSVQRPALPGSEPVTPNREIHARVADKSAVTKNNEIQTKTVVRSEIHEEKALMPEINLPRSLHPFELTFSSSLWQCITIMVRYLLTN